MVYENGKPMWHMERNGNEWKSYRFYISISDVEDLEDKRPEMRLSHVAMFIHGLENANNEIKSNDHYFPNPFDPDSEYCFKKNENFVVTYRGDNPVWYLKRENDTWETHKMIVSREPVNDPIEALLREIEDDFEDFDEFDED